MLAAMSARLRLRAKVPMSVGRASGVATMLRVMEGAEITKKRAVILIMPHLSCVFMCDYCLVIVSIAAGWCFVRVSLLSEAS